MAISYVNSSTRSKMDNNASTTELSIPSGVQEGDLLLAFFTGNADISSTPSGWNRDFFEGDNGRSVVFSKFAAAGDTSGSTPSFGGTSYPFAAVLLVYREVGSVGTVGSQGSTSSTTITAPSRTPSESNEWLLYLGGVWEQSSGNSTLDSTPSGMTVRRTVHPYDGVGYDIWAITCDEVRSTTSSTGTRSSTVSQAGSETGLSLLLAPANQPPNAPTGLSPNGDTLDRTVTNRHNWTFSDPDSGDTQSQYQLQARVQGTTTWTYDVTVATSTTYRDIAGGTFDAGNWEWRVRTWDAAGEVGPYSAATPFVAATDVAYVGTARVLDFRMGSSPVDDIR